MNQKDDEWVLDYIQAENNYRDQILAHTVKLQEILYKEMTARIPEEDFSVPYIYNGYKHTHKH